MHHTVRDAVMSWLDSPRPTRTRIVRPERTGARWAATRAKWSLARDRAIRAQQMREAA
jgi:hypothetical protein